MVMVAEAHAKLEGYGALLDSSDKQIRLFFENELREFDRVRVVHNDGAFIAHLLEAAVIILVAGL